MSITLIRLALIAGILAGMFALGWHEKGIRCDAQVAEAANAQMLIDKQGRAAIEARAATAEKALAMQKQFTYDISKQWEKIRVQPHTHCKLSPDSISLLRSATGRPKGDNPG